MLIAYDPDTGALLGTTGTNSRYPAGPPDPDRWLASLGHPQLATLRVHDLEDAELVARVRDSFCHVADGQLVVEGPHPDLSADRDAIPADDTTPALVTYRSGRAPATVTFDVNGATVTEDTRDGAAAIEVTADAPGPITVTCQGLAVHIDAHQEGTK